MDIASNIKAVRKAKGITPTMMAKELGIEATNYPKFENRGNQLTYNNLEKICSALGITVIELLTWGGHNSESLNHTSDKQQQKRIDELEDRLKDKQFIIEKLTKDIHDISKLINVYMDYLKYYVSEHLRVGVLHYTDATGNTVSIPYKSITNEEYHRLSDEFKNVDIETSKEDDELIIKTLFTDKEFAPIAGYFMSTGFIEDEELIDAYEKYQSDMTAWIPGFHVLKLIDTNNPIVRVLEKGGLLPFGGKR